MARRSSIPIHVKVAVQQNGIAFGYADAFLKDPEIVKVAARYAEKNPEVSNMLVSKMARRSSIPIHVKVVVQQNDMALGYADAFLMDPEIVTLAAQVDVAKMSVQQNGKALKNVNASCSLQVCYDESW